MNKLKKIFAGAIATALVFSIGISAAACNKEGGTTEGNPPEPPAEVSISLDCSQNTLSKGEVAHLNVTVSNAADTSYKWQISELYEDDDTVDNIKVLEIDENNDVHVIYDVTADTPITVTAIANADESKTASHTFTVKPAITGQVGELTASLIEEVSNLNITVSGTVTDRFTDFKNTFNSYETVYDMTVKMQDTDNDKLGDKWYGTFSVRSEEATSSISTTHMRGEDGSLQTQYINKNNEVAVKTETNYESIPVTWENNHLWNHLNGLGTDITNKFEYIASEEVYRYKYDSTSAADAYLMQYLAISLTPMLEQMFTGLYLKVENGHVTGIDANLEPVIYGSDEQNPDSMLETIVELTISDIGTTVVPDIEAYEAPEHAELLQQALETMQNAKNYTYQARETQLSTPDYDAGDYEYDSVPVASKIAAAVPAATTFPYRNNISATGTLGERGFVTENAIVIASTGQYTYTMDGNSYHTEYSGMRNNGDGWYDEFKYVATEDGELVDHFVGQKRIKGDIFDAMPKFDFSPDVFELTGEFNGQYTFVLREGAITRDIAMEISNHSFADDAEDSLSTGLTITVDANGHIISTRFPYNVSYGTYTGYITTTYSAVGTTELSAGAFDNYTQREVKDVWSKYVTQDYSPNHSTLDEDEKADTEQVLAYLFGSADKMVSPSVLLEVFGDNISGPWFDWDENGTNEDGSTKYREHFDFTLSVENSYLDENRQLPNAEFNKIKDQLIEKMEAAGFHYDAANSGDAWGKHYIAFYNDAVMIKIENQDTAYFYFECYKLGEWTLSRK